MTSPNVVFAFDIIEGAFDYVNFGDHSNSAYLDRHTGTSLYFSIHGDSDEEPEDFGDDTRYVAIPDTRDLGMGRQLAIQFVSEVRPALRGEIRDAIKGRGGFRRFKDILNQNGLLDRWYEYEAQYERNLIMEWCAENDIRYTTELPVDE